jgi:hypothetical protein
VSEWSEWFVYRVDGAPIGPLSTKDIAEAILAGKLPPDVWVAAPNVPLSQSRWLRATEVPVIAASLEGMPTRRRSESGMRMISPAPPGVVEEDPDATKIVTGPMRPYESLLSSHPITSSTPPRKLDATLKSSQKGGTQLLPPIGSKPVTEQDPVIDLDKEVGTAPEEPIPETERNSPARGPDGFPLPAFPMPAPTPTPTPPSPSRTPPSYYRGGETLESPGQERSPKKRSSSA